MFIVMVIQIGRHLRHLSRSIGSTVGVIVTAMNCIELIEIFLVLVVEDLRVLNLVTELLGRFVLLVINLKIV